MNKNDNTTAKNIVKDTLARMQKPVSSIYYAKFVYEDGNYTTRTTACHLVTERDRKDANYGVGVFLVLEPGLGATVVYIDMDNGDIFEGKENLVIGYPCGTMDKEIAAMIVPVYKELYLDKTLSYLNYLEANEDTRFTGFRDGFSVMANDLGVLPWEVAGMVRNYR